MHIAVTGANGLIGRAVCEALAARGHAVRALVRRDPEPPIAGAAQVVRIGDIDADTDWAEGLADIDVVLHCAARVHVMRETAADPDAAFHAVNVAGTERLARACVAAGVRRLVFVSSIKVNGEGTAPGRPHTPDDPPAPADAYGRSKRDGEAVLRAIADETALEVTILRPPLVHGPGAGGNFARLWLWAGREYPLPLGRVRNTRALVGIDNLADALALCAERPEAAGRTYLIADAEAVSTPELIRRIAAAQNVDAKLWPVPVWLLRLIGTVTGKRSVIDRLIGSQEVDASALNRDLAWTPRLTMVQGFDRIAAAERADPDATPESDRDRGLGDGPSAPQ